MAQRQGSSIRKTRHLFKKPIRSKGKISLRRFFTVFEVGQPVVLKIDPSIQSARFHKRYYGMRGVVTSKKGFCYVVEIVDGNKKKEFIVHPSHIKKTI